MATEETLKLYVWCVGNFLSSAETFSVYKTIICQISLAATIHSRKGADSHILHTEAEQERLRNNLQSKIEPWKQSKSPGGHESSSTFRS